MCVPCCKFFSGADFTRCDSSLSAGVLLVLWRIFYGIQIKEEEGSEKINKIKQGRMYYINIREKHLVHNPEVDGTSSYNRVVTSTLLLFLRRKREEEENRSTTHGIVKRARHKSALCWKLPLKFREKSGGKKE